MSITKFPQKGKKWGLLFLDIMDYNSYSRNTVRRGGQTAMRKNKAIKNFIDTYFASRLGIRVQAFNLFG